ncbi:phage tail protein [Oceanobacillus oncorhynchi]|uniref:phage tail protein n=1 Tax=Oceanobacillus oncorhynchi TaxID=545501 RepID=UPI001866021B|nr:phage tail protein [Oceanobacillus oncorhynchi]
MYVIDLEGEEYPAQITYTWEAEINGKPIVTAEIEATKVNLLYLHDLTEMWTLVLEDIEYKIKFLKKQGKGNKLRATVKAIPLFFDDFDALRIYERYDRHMTAHFYFSLLFENTKYDFVLNGTFEAQQWEGAGEGKTYLKMFEEGLNRYKGEFRIVGNTVFIENFIGIDSQARYEHRLNASNIVQEIDANELYTFARGYGDYGDGEGGEDWQDANLIREYTSPLARIPGIGIRHAPPIKNGNIRRTDFMDEQLKILVDESLKISVTATIHDLREQGYPIAQSGLGDRVFLIDRRIGFDEEIRVASKMIKKRWDGKVIDASYTFGTPGLVKRHQANMNAAVKNITDLLDGRLKLPFSVLDNAVAEATKALHNMQSELSIPDNGGLMAIDKNNPNNLVLFNAAGLGVSTDGGATFENAITGLGINASVVITGAMLADRIAGGILASLNGNTVFNLNEGQLDMENTKFRLGNGADIQFLDGGNRLYYQRNDWAAGFGVGTSINDTYPFASLGVSRGNRPHANDLSDFSGFIANANDRELVDAVGNSAVGNRFHVRDNAISFSKGFLFKVDDNEPYFSPMNTGTHSYRLGTPNNRWPEIYGSLAGTSTHAAKMNIENIDARKAFDHYAMMNIVSFYYKNEDYTDKFKRRVSPVMEQLDPTLENLYKANPDALDIVSSFFLFVKATQFKWEEFNERLEMLENGTETA